MYICGLDEAGRGSVLGNLCIGCCIMDTETEYDAKDSKKLSVKKRNEYYEKLKEKSVEMSVIEITAEQINDMQDNGVNLNQIEVWGYAQLLNSLDIRPDMIILDSCDCNEERFTRNVVNELDYTPENILSLHKADEEYKIVGAASIIAKTYREQNVNDLKEKYGDEIGSGYPSDTKTIEFLKRYYKKHQEFPKETRIHWKTVKNIRNQLENT